MNAQAMTSAVLAFVITSTTALTVLFSQPDVSNFADISQVAYGSAILGAVTAAATTYKARMAKVPGSEGDV